MNQPTLSDLRSALSAAKITGEYGRLKSLREAKTTWCFMEENALRFEVDKFLRTYPFNCQEAGLCSSKI